MDAVLKVENLRIELTTRDGIAPVIDDLSLATRRRRDDQLRRRIGAAANP